MNRNSINRPGAARRAMALAADLTRAGVNVPDVTAAEKLVAALVARTRAVESDAAVRSRHVAALLADPAADVEAMAVAEVAAGVQRSLLAEARDRAAGDFVAVVLANSDALVLAVREAIFDPAAEELAATAAATRSTDNVGDLLRAGRTDDANALAAAPIAAERVALALGLRRRIYGARSGIDDLPCAVWRNPDVPDRAGLNGLTGADRLLAGLRDGGQLWLPTYAEADDASRSTETAPGRLVASTARRSTRAT
jgi:hypothetical protein